MSEINITPLLDLAFSLLIIFMIAAPLLEQTIPLQLPLETAAAQPQRSEQDYQVISIDAQGVYHWGEEPVTAQRLNELLGALALRAEPPVLHLRGDATLPYQKVIDVIDMVKQHKLSRISLDTQAR